MSWYIGTLEQCEAYNRKVCEVKNYTGSHTSNWDTPHRHPEDDYYCIEACASVEPDEESSLQLVEELGKDWRLAED